MTPEQRKQAKALVKSVFKSCPTKSGYPLNIGETRLVSSGFRLDIDGVPRKVVADTVSALQNSGFKVDISVTPLIPCVRGVMGGHRVMYVRL